jgi:hypothetical protein
MWTSISVDSVRSVFKVFQQQCDTFSCGIAWFKWVHPFDSIREKVMRQKIFGMI